VGKLFSLKAGSLPSKGRAGDCYFTTDSKEVYIAVADGALLNLADLLSGAMPHVRVVGPQGEQGIRGMSGARGAKGEPGTPGKDADVHVNLAPEVTAAIQRAVADAVAHLPLPEGREGQPGRPGPKGDPGDPGRDGQRIDAVVLAEIKLELKALRDAVKQSDDYLAYLKGKAQRRKS